LTTSDIYEKYPYYDIAQDLTTVQDILVWDNLTSIDRINYQGIANKISLYWQTYKLPAGENYADELNATNLRGYLRDEVYAFEIVFILRNGKQTDGFHIPGRAFLPSDVRPDVPTTNDDFIGEPDYTIGTTGYSKYWKIYNTATVLGNTSGEKIGNATPYQYGNFAYWESTELYPCNTDVWGDLANQPIRHHKFPDVLVSPVYESAFYSAGGPVSPVIQNDAIFPIGVKVDLFQIRSLINSSSLTQEQKEDVVAFKIVRGNRNTNKSIIAKGILRNVGKYNKEETTYYFPNYPYNDLRQDPFLLDKSNAFTANADLTSNTTDTCRNFTITAYEDSTYEYVDCFSQTLITKTIATGTVENFCAISLPVVTSGRCCMVSNTYTRWLIAGCKSCTQGFSYFDIIDAFGLYSTNTYPPGTPGGGGGPIHTCDFCRSNPGDAACVGGVYGTGQFNKYNAVVGSGLFDVTYFYVNSLIKPVYTGGDPFEGTITEVGKTGYDLCAPTNLEAFKTDDSKYRQVFNSPETSFAQPFLGGVLKLENVMFGAGESHFVQVKKNAMYKLLTIEAQQDALASSDHIAGVTVGSYNPVALFAAYQAYLTIYVNGITRRNYAYSYNSRASYDYSASINNGLGIKQRQLELSQYLIPAVQAIGDNYNFNNYQRESSVYLKTSTNNASSTTVTPLPFPDATPSMLYGSLPILSDRSRATLSDYGCNTVLPEQIKPISVVSYYGSLKNIFVNQWGQMYSYETIDTGFQRNINPIINEADVVFGGDTFINRFAFKTKLPFFIDNRVGAPDDSDIFFDELGNVAYPEYWHSARSILTNGTASGVDLTNFISIKAHNFDCPNSQVSTLQGVPNAGRTFYDGKMYLFAYGIPNFYCESSYNMDLRQAFNNKEGDFWPHVSTGIPDDWMQESNVTIAQDNTYYYNVTFSKQNKENYFSHLPQDWKQQLCFTHYPFRAIYSDQADANADNRVNAWLSYGATAKFDFPQNFGKLTSLDGIQNKAVLARFENKSLLYNTLLTVNTSNPQAAYLGNDTLFKSSPPIDFAETDLGYVGSQHKFLLKIPQGQITVDAKRGQVFLVAGNQATDLSTFGSGLNRFFTDHLAFEILRYFPDVDIDNHFNGLGLHGVYDSKFDRVIISKLDYIPQPGKNIVYDANTKEFYNIKTINNAEVRSRVYITDFEYFCNKSWTLSFNMNTKSWISFHSYIPNFYIAENNFFYSGLNGSCDLELLAISEVPCTTTTTTTMPVKRPGTTSSTTTLYVDCALEGTGEKLPTNTTTTTSTTTIIADCTLVGTAVGQIT
jgi:hypothetical protein